jgi:hypothetical protein
MKLVEVLIALIVFSLFASGVMSQLDSEAKLYHLRAKKLYELEAIILLIR